MRLEVRHLRLMEAIAEEGSVTRAANQLYLTQSALSHQLRDVEEKLGVPLFDRINKRMVLTPAGERLLGSARKVLDELRRAEEDVQQIALRREGVLRISTECYTCYHWLPPLLKMFNREHPRIEVRIVVEATRDPHQALLDGRIDLALVSSPTRDSKVVHRPLFGDELVVILGREHYLSDRPYIKAEDFINEHLLIYSSPEENRAVQQVLTPAGVSPRQVSSVQLTEAIIEMVRAGIGVGILASWAVAPQIESGAIRALPLTRRGLHRRWSAATLKNKSTPHYLNAFIDMLADNPTLVTKEGGKPERGKAGVKHLKTLNCSKQDDKVVTPG